MTAISLKDQILEGIPADMPIPKFRNPDVSHAPNRKDILNNAGKKLALKNALRYLPTAWHEEIVPELLEELNTYGRIYMYRLKPDYELKARHLDDFPHKSRQAAAPVTGWQRLPVPAWQPVPGNRYWPVGHPRVRAAAEFPAKSAI